MSDFQELAFLDATEQARMVKSRHVKPIELVDAAIERIESVNPQLNAVVTPIYDMARDLARKSLPEGPFAGVPFLLKDMIASYNGVPITHGTKNLRAFIPDHDSELVRRYKRAGLIILGKTNAPELGLLPTTEPELFGPCHNPWNTGKTAGGSSGGSAAAVASGMVPVAHGSDGGGSIRIPASCCGLFGLKPTRGRNPLGPDFGDLLSGMVVEHVLSRSVRDSAAILDATMGYDIGDPYCAPPPKGPYLQEVGKNPGTLRIACIKEPLNDAVLAGDCMLAINDAIDLCEQLGHQVTEVTPDINAEVLTWAFTVIWTAGCASTINSIAYISGQKPSADQYERVTWGLYEMGSRYGAADYLMALQSLQKISRDVGKIFVDYDILMTPVLSEPPVDLGAFDSPADDLLAGWRRAIQYVPFTPLCNATGQPAMSVPLYWNSAGLPIGTHFAGPFGDEGVLFQLASQLEDARPWQNRRPLVSAL